jgi:hypothetical protein
MQKYLIIREYPDNETISRVIAELDSMPDFPVMLEDRVHTRESYEAWKQEPEQLAWLQQKAQEAEAARLAQEQAEAQAKSDAIESEIQSIMTVFNYTRKQAELLYNLQIKNANK